MRLSDAGGSAGSLRPAGRERFAASLRGDACRQGIGAKRFGWRLAKKAAAPPAPSSSCRNYALGPIILGGKACTIFNFPLRIKQPPATSPPGVCIFRRRYLRTTSP